MERVDEQFVSLGFLTASDKSSKKYLKRNHMPSKFGGKPSWLNTDMLPSISQMVCRKCGLVYTFLLQLYNGDQRSSNNAETDSEDRGLRTNCHHRMLYLFGCKECKTEFVVLRNQLPRMNRFLPSDISDFSSSDDEPERIEEVSEECVANTVSNKSQDEPCEIPNVESDMLTNKNEIKSKWREILEEDEKKLEISCCEICGNPRFDHEECRILSSPHRKCMNQEHHATVSVCFPECFLDDYREVKSHQKPDNILAEEAHAAKLYKEYLQKLANLELEGSSEDNVVLNSAEAEGFEDIHQTHLKKKGLAFQFDAVHEYFIYRTNIDASSRNHVIRYVYDGLPLWASTPSSMANIPKCQNCGSRRVFEFQVQPELLYFIDSDRLEFSCLYIYTCSKNCDVSADTIVSAYVNEHVVVQQELAK